VWNVNRLRSLAYFAAFALVAGGCQATGGSSPDETVRAYVDAINARDGGAVCDLLTEEGAYEFLDWLVEEEYADQGVCADYISALIGYGEESDTDTFQRARILDLSEGERVGDVLGMELRVEVELNDDGNEQERITREFDDVVWLVERRGRWLLAKPSGLLMASFAAYTVPEDLLEAPDPEVQRREYERKIEAQRQRQEAERRAFAPIGGIVFECAGTRTSQDDVGSDLGDLDSQGVGDVTRELRDRLGVIDLRRVEVETQGEELCVRVTVRGGVIEERLRIIFEIYSPAKSHIYRSALDLVLEVDADGKGRFGYEDKDVQDEYGRHPLRFVPSQLGRDGETFAFRVARDDLPDATKYFSVPEWSGFLWSTTASTEIEVNGSRREVRDFLHEQHAGMTSHPGGQVFTVYERLERDLPTD
jgi:hypothetical protein